MIIDIRHLSMTNINIRLHFKGHMQFVLKDAGLRIDDVREIVGCQAEK